MTTHHPRHRSNEEGAALILAVLFVLALSAVGSAMVVLARTEAYSSMNYRMMSQSRYAAESGVHKAINHLLNPAAYTLPGGPGDPLANYDMTTSPVQFNGQPVVLSTITGVASNYPFPAAITAFNAAGQGLLNVGAQTVTYQASATLLSMRDITAFGAVNPTVVQTWRITGVGFTTGVQQSDVEVSATLEQQVVPSHMYAAFATSPICGALTFTGGGSTDSYDSSNMVMTTGANPHPVTQSTAGNVGSNGNLTASGGTTTISGTLSTPRSGVGTCKNGAVDADTLSGGAAITGGVLPLPQNVAYPAPDLPNPLPPTTGVTINNSATCATIGLSAPVCTGGSNNFVFTPGGSPISMGNVSLSGGATLHLAAGTYNFNSISLSGNSAIIIDSGPVVMSVVGTGKTNPVDFSGGSTSNQTFDPSMFRVLYGGAGGVKLSGGTGSSAMVYAPNADINFSGGSNFYGAVVGATVTDSGGTDIHYDRSLNASFGTTGNRMLTSFTWKKF